MTDERIDVAPEEDEVPSVSTLPDLIIEAPINGSIQSGGLDVWFMIPGNGFVWMEYFVNDVKIFEYDIQFFSGNIRHWRPFVSYVPGPARVEGWWSYGLQPSRRTVTNFWISNVPMITYPAENEFIQNRRPKITGTGGGNCSLKVRKSSSTISLSAPFTATANEWTVDLNQRLPWGDYSIAIEQSRAGYTTRYSLNRTFTIIGAELSSPMANQIVPSHELVFEGESNSGMSVHVVREDNHYVALSNAVNVPGSEQWEVKLKEDLVRTLQSGELSVTAQWRRDAWRYGYSDILTFKVLGVPVITSPAGSSAQEQTFTLSGNNGLAGAKVEIYEDTQTVKLGESGVLTGATWTVQVDLKPGPRSLVALQRHSGKQSVRGAPRSFKIRPPVPSITSSLSGETVTLSGTGYNGIGVRMDIHFRNNATPYLDATVSAGSWSKVIPPDLLPGNYNFGGRQSVSDGGSGRIYNTGWVTDIPVNIPTPVPTSVSFTVSGQRATFKGRGRQWGTAAVGVGIFNDGVALAGVPHANVQTNLNWETTATADLAPGNYTQLTARQGVNSQWSADSARFSMVIASPPPTFTAPGAGANTGQRPTISGTAWPGSAIVLTIPGKTDVPLTANGGNFSLTAAEDWAPTTYTITAKAAFGGQTSTPASRTFTVKTPQPTITTAADAEVDLSPVIDGTGYKGCWVVIYSNVTNQSIGAGPVGPDNKWKVTLADQAPGNLGYYAIQQEEQTSNNRSDRTAARTVKVRVPKPLIRVPTQNGRPARESLFSGTGQYPGTVELSIKGQTTPFLKDIVVNAEGTWQAHVTLPAGGPVMLEARLLQRTYISDPLEHVVTVVPAVPVIDTPRNAEALGALLRISGFGYPGDTIRIDNQSDKKTLGSTEVKEGGTWSKEVRLQLAANHKITAVAISSSNREWYSGYTSEIVMSLLKPAPKINQPAEGDWVTAKPQYSGEATPNATITVASWFNTSNLLAPPTTAGANGLWTVMGNKDLPVGGAWVVVRQTLPDGTASEWAESGRFNVEV
nr:hypothetical protein [Pseudomonas caspiana]